MMTALLIVVLVPLGLALSIFMIGAIVESYGEPGGIE
jgi:hypothetical protein